MYVNLENIVINGKKTDLYKVYRVRAFPEWVKVGGRLGIQVKNKFEPPLLNGHQQQWRNVFSKSKSIKNRLRTSMLKDGLNELAYSIQCDILRTKNMKVM